MLIKWMLFHIYKLFPPLILVMLNLFYQKNIKTKYSSIYLLFIHLLSKKSIINFNVYNLLLINISQHIFNSSPRSV